MRFLIFHLTVWEIPMFLFYSSCYQFSPVLTRQSSRIGDFSKYIRVNKRNSPFLWHFIFLTSFFTDTHMHIYIYMLTSRRWKSQILNFISSETNQHRCSDYKWLLHCFIGNFLKTKSSQTVSRMTSLRSVLVSLRLVAMVLSNIQVWRDNCTHLPSVSISLTTMRFEMR